LIATCSRYSPAVIVASILVIATTLRLIALFDLRHTIYFDYLLLDESVYHTWATHIALGTYNPSSVYEYPPVPAYMIALLYRAFSPDPFYTRILNVSLGVITCYIFYLIGHELAGRTVGYLSALIACFYKPLIFYSVVPLKAALSVLLFALFTCLFLRYHDSRFPRMMLFLIGATVGLMLLTRGNSAVVLPIVMIAVVARGHRSRGSPTGIVTELAVLGVGFALVLTPVAARNYRVAGEVAFMPSQAGFNLYLGNTLENPSPYFAPVPFAWPSAYDMGPQFTIEASRRAGARLSASEASAFWARETVKMLAARPREALLKLGQKALVVVNRFEPGDIYSIDFMARFIPLLSLPLVTLTVVLPFGITGIVTAGLRSPKAIGAATIGLAYGSTLVIFFTMTRYRLPLLVVLIPFAVIAIRDLCQDLADRRVVRLGVSLALIAVFTVIEFLPLKGAGDLTPYFYRHGVILSWRGLQEEAVDYWQESSRMRGRSSDFADVLLAMTYRHGGDDLKALEYLRRIPDTSPAASEKYETLGDVAVSQARIGEAITAYERSLEINAGMIEPRRKLIRLYESVDPKSADEHRRLLKYILSFQTEL
jgi:4-amino-4-deoxy-L-arabinose transferase-like glycosyltransferase